MYEKGSTLILAICTKIYLIAANLGDSKIFGILKDSKSLLPLTKSHNLSNQDEISLIQSKGGLIFKRGAEYRING